MIKEKKGFIVSLELLLFVLSLAVIIAIPIIITIISKSKENAMLEIAKQVDDASYRYFIANLGTEETLYLSKDMSKLGIAGAKPDGGIVRIKSTGNISFAIYNEDWCVVKKDSNSKYEIKKYVLNECSLPEDKK